MTRWAHLENGNKRHKAGGKPKEMRITETLGKAQADGVEGVTDLFHRQPCFNSNMPDPCSIKMHDNVPRMCVLGNLAYILLGDDGPVEGIL